MDNKRGGNRPGAGRPKGVKKISKSFTINKEFIDDERINSKLVNKLLIEWSELNSTNALNLLERINVSLLNDPNTVEQIELRQELESLLILIRSSDVSF